MGKHILKGYIGDIFFEFLLQDGPADCAYFLPGFPSSNKYTELMKFLYQKGFHVFTIRYGGSYQSRGKFLEKNPVSELVDFFDELTKGKITSLWDLKEFSFEPKNHLLFASSFGGAIACGVAAKSNIFDKAILFAPVWNFSEHNTTYQEQDLQHLTQFTKRAFQNCYRFEFKDIQSELEKFEEIKPSFYISRIKIPFLVFHGKKDYVVNIRHSERMQKELDITLVKHEGGHGPKIELLENYWETFSKFIN